jgi:GNAT superfamily N-acetyltransferase
MEKLVIRGPLFDQSRACEPVLRSLPDWFGIETSIQRYVKEIDLLPTLLAFIADKPIGFLTLKYHSEYAAEICVMGVYERFHRRGVGCALLERAENVLRQEGVEYLQVKTLSPSRADEHYAWTRAFYHAMGFRPLEEIKQIWDEDNPCLLMVKYIGQQAKLN